MVFDVPFAAILFGNLAVPLALGVSAWARCGGHPRVLQSVAIVAQQARDGRFQECLRWPPLLGVNAPDGATLRNCEQPRGRCARLAVACHGEKP
jgi:hypothetical protein